MGRSSGKCSGCGVYLHNSRFAEGITNRCDTCAAVAMSKLEAKMSNVTNIEALIERAIFQVAKGRNAKKVVSEMYTKILGEDTDVEVPQGGNSASIGDVVPATPTDDNDDLEGATTPPQGDAASAPLTTSVPGDVAAAAPGSLNPKSAPTDGNNLPFAESDDTWESWFAAAQTTLDRLIAEEDGEDDDKKDDKEDDAVDEADDDKDDDDKPAFLKKKEESEDGDEDDEEDDDSVEEADDDKKEIPAFIQKKIDAKKDKKDESEDGDEDDEEEPVEEADDDKEDADKPDFLKKKDEAADDSDDEKDDVDESDDNDDDDKPAFLKKDEGKTIKKPKTGKGGKQVNELQYQPSPMELPYELYKQAFAFGQQAYKNRIFAPNDDPNMRNLPPNLPSRGVTAYYKSWESGRVQASRGYTEAKRKRVSEEIGDLIQVGEEVTFSGEAVDGVSPGAIGTVLFRIPTPNGSAYQVEFESGARAVVPRESLTIGANSIPRNF